MAQVGIQKILALTLSDLYTLEAAQLAHLEPLIRGLEGQPIQSRFVAHVQEGTQHLALLDDMLSQHAVPKDGRKNKMALQLLADIERTVRGESAGPERDKILATSLKKLEDLEVSLYKTARSFALHGTNPDVVDTLTRILKQKQMAVSSIEAYLTA